MCHIAISWDGERNWEKVLSTIPKSKVLVSWMKTVELWEHALQTYAQKFNSTGSQKTSGLKTKSAIGKIPNQNQILLACFSTNYLVY